MTEYTRWSEKFESRPAAATVSLFQIVAYNLALGRRERGLTQEELGDRLEGITGRPWSKATVSAAESAWFGRGAQKKERQFDAMEIGAFAFALQLPFLWFFLPPPQRPDGGPVERDVPWISLDKGRRFNVPAVTSGDWQALIFKHSDPDDVDQVMARRLRKEGIEPSTPHEDFLSELAALVARHRASHQAEEES